MSNQSPTANGRGQSPDEALKKNSHNDEQDEEISDKSHGPLKGTDTQATLDAEYAEREKGKRTTM